MEKLNYLKLLVQSCFGKISKENLILLCVKYKQQKSRLIGLILKNQWRFCSVEEVVSCLRLYGGRVCGYYGMSGYIDDGNLWKLYFKLKKKKPFDFEAEELLIQQMDVGGSGYKQLPHALTERGELSLVEWRFAQRGKEEDTYYTGYYSSSQRSFSEKGLNNYIEKFALSEVAFNTLVANSIRYNEYGNLINFFRVLDKKPECKNVVNQLQLIKLLQSTHNCCVVVSVIQYYSMLNAPSLEFISELLLNFDEKFDNRLFYLKELLSHSWLANGKEAVLKIYPQLKNRVLLAEICHEMCLNSKLERKRMISPEYSEMLNHDECKVHPWIESTTLPDGNISMLALCMRLYHVCEREYETVKIMEKAIDCCNFYNVPKLKRYIPQLQEAIREYQSKL